MSLKKTVYSVLIVSSADNFFDSVSSLLSPSEYSPVIRANSISSAKRLFAERQFDFIIINSPLADDTGISFACDICESSASAVLLFARGEIFAAVNDELTPYGAFALNKPVSRNTAMTAFLWMAATRERLRKREKKSVSIEQKMKEIRIINRAKWLLIEKEGLSEPEAHRYIEKQAMDKCVPKIDIANEIINS